MTKVLVSLDDRLLERLDQVAADRGMSRSALIAELARRGLGEPVGPGATPQAKRALEQLQTLFREAPPADSTALIRQDRDARR